MIRSSACADSKGGGGGGRESGPPLKNQESYRVT